MSPIFLFLIVVLTYINSWLLNNIMIFWADHFTVIPVESSCLNVFFYNSCWVIFSTSFSEGRRK